MNDVPQTTPSFNALTDAWLPLLDSTGATTMASVVEVLCGEKDGIDLDYPRDDFRIYARLLLSALVQALFPARTKQELEDRLDNPLPRAEVERRILPVLDDFNLFGTTPFLQIPPLPSLPKKGAAPFVFGRADLYQPATVIESVSLPIALVTLFTEHAYAGGAGRGYGAGPGGQPGAFTLIDPGTVRLAAWANTLTAERAAGAYAAEGNTPWSNAPNTKGVPRASLGLVGGLFFQPRGMWLIPEGTGKCAVTGVVAPLVRLSPLTPKSTLMKKPSKGEDLWQHPCAPMAVNSQGIGPVRLNVRRPAWAGLAQLLSPIAGSKTRAEHPLQGPAPVLQQWKTLVGRPKRPRLLVLDFDRDKANVKRQFFEAFPITTDLVGSAEALERIRLLVTEAEKIERDLMRQLVRAHDDRKQGGLALADARAEYWSTSEAPFFRWLDVVTSPGADDAWGIAQGAQDDMLDSLQRAAIAIFDRHVEISEFDPRKLERIAMARRTLRRALRDNTVRPGPSTITKETPQ